MLAYVTTIGGIAYAPVWAGIGRLENSQQAQVSDTKAALASITDPMVTQKEMEWRTARGAEDRQRTEGAIKDLRSDMVPRAEHERVWQSYTATDASLQRQTEELKRTAGSVYGQRDINLDLR